MRRFWKLGLAAAIAAAIAVPAAVLAESSGTDRVQDQIVDETGAQQTNSKQWKNLPGLSQFVAVEPSFTVGAAMTSGKAKFRVITQDGPATPTAGIRYAAPAANSYSWFRNGGVCGNAHVEWKRVGKHTAKLAHASMLTLDQEGCG